MKFVYRQGPRMTLLTAALWGVVIGLAILLGMVCFSCVATGTNGRTGTVEAAAEVEAKVKAQVDSVVSAALVQWKSEIKNEVKAEIKAAIGDSVGRDKTTTKTTTDSWTSVILAAGMIAIGMCGLTLYYNVQWGRTHQVNKRLIGAIEKRREFAPCDCGKCADCMVREFKGRGDAVGRWMHAAVKKAT